MSKIKMKAKLALQNAFEAKESKNSCDCKGYVSTYQDNLIKSVNEIDYVKDLLSAGGNLRKKQFRAIHSSLAMTVNNFLPFRTRLEDLNLPIGENFKTLEFEEECPAWNSKIGVPQLDVLITGSTEVIAIESKLLEFLESPNECFADTYSEKLNLEQKSSAYYKEMLRMQSKVGCKTYQRLDVAQLIKHAFGLIYTFPNRPVTLIYLYWEPSNLQELTTNMKSVFDKHKQEIVDFSNRVCGSKPKFMAKSYSELWQLWEQDAPQWLIDHLNEVKSRYSVALREIQNNLS